MPNLIRSDVPGAFPERSQPDPFRVPGTQGEQFPGALASVTPTMSLPRRGRHGGNTQHPDRNEEQEPRPDLLTLIDTGRAQRSAVALQAMLALLADRRWHHFTHVDAAATATGISLHTASDILWAATRAGRIQRDRPQAPQYFRLPGPYPKAAK